MSEDVRRAQAPGKGGVRSQGPRGQRRQGADGQQEDSGRGRGTGTAHGEEGRAPHEATGQEKSADAKDASPRTVDLEPRETLALTRLFPGSSSHNVLN